MRQGWGYVAVAGVLALVWVEFWRGMPRQEARGPATAPAASRPVASDADLAYLDVDLASADPERQGHARAALAAATYRDRPELMRIAAATDDERVQALLLARVEAINKSLIEKPPPVTIETRGEHLSEILDTLNTRMGTTLTGYGNAGTPGLFSLPAEPMAFWDVLFALDAQHPVMFTPGHRMTLKEAAPGMGQHTVQGPFLLYAYVTHDATQKGQFHFALAPDPRINVIRIVSDFKLTIDPPNAAFPALERRLAGYGTPVVNIMHFDLPELPPATTMSLSLDVQAKVAVIQREGDLEDVHAGAQTMLGTTRVSVEEFDISDSPQAEVLLRAANGDQPADLAATLFNAQGDVCFAVSGVGDVERGTSYFARLPPYRLHVVTPEKLVDVPAHLELKDIPLAPGPGPAAHALP